MAMRFMSPAQYAAHWKTVGPELRYLRWRELREYDHASGWPTIAGLLDLAVSHGPPPECTSGLVEWQRALMRKKP
jgi:hypothetical protein